MGLTVGLRMLHLQLPTWFFVGRGTTKGQVWVRSLFRLLLQMRPEPFVSRSIDWDGIFFFAFQFFQAISCQVIQEERLD